MPTLIIAEHDHQSLKPSTHHVVAVATKLGEPITILVAGTNCAAAAQASAAILGVIEVLQADDPAYEHFLAENMAALVAKLAPGYTHVLAAATTTGRNFMPRAAGLCDVAQISDIIAVESADTFQRPIYAGNAIATVKSTDRIKFITVRNDRF